MAPTLVAPSPNAIAEGINQIAYSQDGSRMAYSDVRMNVYLPGGVRVSVRSPNEKARSCERVRGLAFSMDGTRVFVAAADYVWEFDAVTGDELWKCMLPRTWGFLVASPVSVAVSRQDLLAVSSDSGQLLTWDGRHRQVDRLATNQPQRGLTFLANGRVVMSFEGYSINRFDLVTGIKTLRLPVLGQVYAMATSPDGDFVGLRTLSEFMILDVVSNRTLHTQSVLPGLPLAASHPTKALFAVAEEHSVLVVDLTGRPLVRVEIADAKVVSIAFQPQGDLIIGRSDHQIDRYPLGLG